MPHKRQRTKIAHKRRRVLLPALVVLFALFVSMSLQAEPSESNAVADDRVKTEAHPPTQLPSDGGIIVVTAGPDEFPSPFPGHAYLGAASCRGCHATIYEAWATTRHARAFKTLCGKTSPADKESCFRCHVTGYRKTGGFIDPKVTPDLVGVGCEACHGPGRRHVEIRRTGEEQSGDDGLCSSCSTRKECLSCHTVDRSPDFDYRKAKKKVHPKNGTR